MDDLVGEFIADTRESYERVLPDLVAWQNDPSNRAALDSVFRFVHTVRGNCGFLNFERFEKLCVPTEQALVAVREGKTFEPAFVARIVAVINRVGALADAIELGLSLSAHDEGALVADLENVPAPAPAARNSVSVAPQSRSRTIRIPVDQFDHLATCVEGVDSAFRNMMAVLVATPEAQPAFLALSQSICAMSQALTTSRMQPLDRIYTGLDRIVDQTAAALGKDVTLHLVGGNLMVDRDVVDGLRDPLLHLIRNALDHGLETPSARIGSGKPQAGTLRVEAQIDHDELVLTIADDGRGVDPAALAGAARLAGLSVSDSLSDGDIAALILRPGLSTAGASTVLSGRGVGMDAVNASVQRLNGSLSLQNRVGLGLTFALTIPLRSRMADAA